MPDAPTAPVAPTAPAGTTPAVSATPLNPAASDQTAAAWNHLSDDVAKLNADRQELAAATLALTEAQQRYDDALAAVRADYAACQQDQLALADSLSQDIGAPPTEPMAPKTERR